jgi:hypothetical protein
VEKQSAALFFKYNTQLGPPYQVLVDTNFINFSIKNKASGSGRVGLAALPAPGAAARPRPGPALPQIDLVKGMMDCLYAKCTPCITDCVMAELEKLGQKYRVALKIAKVRPGGASCRGPHAGCRVPGAHSRRRAWGWPAAATPGRPPAPAGRRTRGSSGCPARTRARTPTTASASASSSISATSWPPATRTSGGASARCGGVVGARCRCKLPQPLLGPPASVAGGAKERCAGVWHVLGLTAQPAAPPPPPPRPLCRRCRACPSCTSPVTSTLSSGCLRRPWGARPGSACITIHDSRLRVALLYVCVWVCVGVWCVFQL